MALKTCLNDGADINDRRIASHQRLGGELAATKKNNFGIEAVLPKKSRILSNPDVNLVVRDSGIADFDFLDILRARGSQA